MLRRIEKDGVCELINRFYMAQVSCPAIARQRL